MRHTFITNLVSAGVAPQDAKELARHSTITLTMDRYAHVNLQNTAAAVARFALPGPSASGHREQQGAAAGAAEGEKGRKPSGAAEEVSEIAQPLKMLENKAKRTNERRREGKRKVRPVGVEPTRFRLEGGCSVQLSYGRKRLKARRIQHISDIALSWHYTRGTEYAPDYNRTGHRGVEAEKAVPRLPVVLPPDRSMGQKGSRQAVLLRHRPERRTHDVTWPVGKRSFTAAPVLRALRNWSAFHQDEIDHPAPADVNSLRVAAVAQDVVVVAPGVLKGVREDRHRAEVA